MPKPPPDTLDAYVSRSTFHFGLDDTDGVSLADLVTIPERQQEIVSVLNGIRAGWADRARKAALSPVLLTIRLEKRLKRRLEPELPLYVALLEAEVAILEAQSVFAKADLLARRAFPDADRAPHFAAVEEALLSARRALARILQHPNDIAELREAEIPRRRLRPAPSTRAISIRLMPRVRAAVFAAISPAVRSYHKTHAKPIRLGAKQLRESSAAYELTSAYLRAFFPRWGASTTPELVRKAVRNLESRPRSAARK